MSNICFSFLTLFSGRDGEEGGDAKWRVGEMKSQFHQHFTVHTAFEPGDLHRLYWHTQRRAWGRKFGHNFYSQFHQHFTHKFFVQMLFQQLFSSYMYVVKAAKTTFVRKICVYNVDEIDTCTYVTFLYSIILSVQTNNSKISSFPIQKNPKTTFQTCRFPFQSSLKCFKNIDEVFKFKINQNLFLSKFAACLS